MGEFPLLLNDMEPIHWLIAGCGIGAIVVGLQWFSNRSFGISASLENLCAVASRRPVFKQEDTWRLPFVVGLISAGILSALMGGNFEWSGQNGMLDSVIQLGPIGKTVWMFSGGLLIGFGTRLSGGCTSGHGIFGISIFQRSSIIATVCFMGAGMGTTFLVYRILSGGG